MSYNKLRGKIKEVFGTQEAFGAAIGMSQTGISLRLNNKVKWSSDEIQKIKDVFDLDTSEIGDYFFYDKV